MSRLLRIEITWSAGTARLAWGLAFGLGWTILQATAVLAVPASLPAGTPVPCATLEEFGGNAQILDQSRTHTVDAVKGAGIQCGSWVSVNEGWMSLRHREGFSLRLGSHTFIQLPEANTDGNFSGDPVVLFKGQLFGQAGGGTGTLKVVTANARARVARGSVIVVYDPKTEESQLVVLENLATLENRFQSRLRMKVAAGESSALNLMQLKVTPQGPRAVALAPLKAKLEDLHFPEREYEIAVRTAKFRAERTFASAAEVQESDEQESPRPGRGPASAKAKPRAKNQYPATEGDSVVRSQLARKLAGGDSSAEKMLFPEKFHGRPQRVKLEVVDPGAKLVRQSRSEEEREKKRLIEELSQIKIE